MSNPQCQALENRDYLGDGVYAGWDGFHVVLWIEYPGTFGPGAIALDPRVLKSLERYIERLRQETGS